MDAKRVNTNFFSPEAVADPYSLYDEVRAVGNVAWNELLAGWMIAGFDAAAAVLTDNERFAEVNSGPELIFWFAAPNMITVDGRYHRRLRGSLAPLFTRSAVAKWEPRVTEVVKELVAPLAAGTDSY